MGLKVAVATLAALAILPPTVATFAETSTTALGSTTVPAEPVAPDSCRPTMLYEGSPQLQGVSGRVSFKHGSTTNLPKGAQTLIIGQGKRFNLPLDAGSWMTPVDLAPGTYEIGIAEAGGARWISPAPRAKLTIVGSRTAKFQVTEKFPCEMDATPAATGWVSAASGDFSPHVPVKKLSSSTDAATGVLSVTYEGQGLVPVGRLELTHAPSVPATVWTTTGYGGTAACRARIRKATPALESMANLPAGAGDPTVYDAPAGATAITITFAYTAQAPKQPEMRDIALARSPPPGTVCHSEP